MISENLLQLVRAGIPLALKEAMWMVLSGVFSLPSELCSLNSNICFRHSHSQAAHHMLSYKKDYYSSLVIKQHDYSLNPTTTPKPIRVSYICLTF